MREFLLPLRGRAFEGCDILSLRLGALCVQLGQLGHRCAQQWTTMITATRVFDVGERLVSRGQA